MYKLPSQDSLKSLHLPNPIYYKLSHHLLLGIDSPLPTPPILHCIFRIGSIAQSARIFLWVGDWIYRSGFLWDHNRGLIDASSRGIVEDDGGSIWIEQLVDDALFDEAVVG